MIEAMIGIAFIPVLLRLCMPLVPVVILLSMGLMFIEVAEKTIL